MDAGDLRAPDADAAHQPLLVEDEGIDALLERRRREILAESLVEDHQAGAGPQLEPLALVEVAERGLIHEEERVAEGLGPGLEAVGGGQRAVVAGDLPALAQRPVAVLARDDEAALQDAREHQHRDRLVAQLLRVRHGAIERRERLRGFAADLARARRQRGVRAEDAAGEQRQRRGQRRHSPRPRARVPLRHSVLLWATWPAARWRRDRTGAARGTRSRSGGSARPSCPAAPSSPRRRMRPAAWPRPDRA